MERYTPVRGMIVCSEGGDYILYEDHIAYLRSFEEHHNAQVAELEKEVRKLLKKISDFERLFSRYAE